jgi:hypothetical protein
MRQEPEGFSLSGLLDCGTISLSLASKSGRTVRWCMLGENGGTTRHVNWITRVSVEPQVRCVVCKCYWDVTYLI